MRTVKLEYYQTVQSLSEASSNGLQYAFVSDDNKQITPWVFCKDYFQDAIQAYLNNDSTLVYGFSYKSGKDIPICLHTTRLALVSKDDGEFSSKILKSLSFIHQVESDLKMKKTEIQIVSNVPKKFQKSGVFIFNGSGRWMKSPPMISLYTLLIRVGLVHELSNTWRETIDSIIEEKKSPYYSEDHGFLQVSKNPIDKIVSLSDKKIFGTDIKRNYPKDVEHYTMHNYFGIVALGRAISGSSYNKDNFNSHVRHWMEKLC